MCKKNGLWFGGESYHICEEIRAGLGETCGGFNESTMKPYPDCEKGLKCLRTGLKSAGGGASNTCQEIAGLGEPCEGWNETTGKPYPYCKKGLKCLSTGLLSPGGGGGKTCQKETRKNCTKGRRLRGKC